ncbi:MAG: hypothetical protein FJX06_02845 [Alphaproteobacteria bacterium]|nr:hypothetical protein [Alphaproteobacteria bacterium]
MKARVTADDAEVARIEEALAAARNALALTDIVSPVDGAVISRNGEIGQKANVNQEPPLFVVAPNSSTTQE